jgi:ABC-type amino acid transport system permease subunit
MWMLFATTLNVSMRWLRGKPLLAALLGLVGGPAAYTAGEAMGGIVLVDQTAAVAALAIGWACIMPLLVWLASHLDGMPGARRKWLTEGAA